MSLNFYFYVEVRTAEGWNRPEVFAFKTSTYGRCGEFTWLRGRSPVQHLFFGDGAVFKFRRERPSDTEHSALFQYLDCFYDYEEDESRLSWIPFEDLLVDLWDEPSLIIRGRVRADLALYFGNGQQLFPSDALNRAGMNPYEISDLREGWMVTEAIDRSYGRGRYEVEETSPETLIEVTWLDSVEGYISQPRADAFRSLTQYGEPGNLRVISLYS